MDEQEIIKLGIVGIKNMGEYDSQTNYKKLNVVTYQGNSYCALRDTLGNLPTNTEYWQLYAEKGGVGPQGPKPVKGVDYFTSDDINAIEEDLSGFISETISETVSDSVGSLVSATPLVVSSVTDMTDTTRIYVNTIDGHWYWYDGATWQDGGVYQSTGIGLNEVKLENLASDVSGIFDVSTPEITTITGKYIGASTGNTQPNASYHIKTFTVKAGYTIKVNSTIGSAGAAIAFYNTETEKYIPVVVGSDVNNNVDYYFTAIIDGTYAISCKTAGNSDILTYLKEKTILDDLNNYKGIGYFENPTVTLGKYISAAGNYSDNSAYNIVDVGTIKTGKTIHVRSACPSSVSVIAKKNTNNTYTPLIIGRSGDNLLDYEYTLSEDTHIVISYRNTRIYSYYYYYKVSNIYDNVLEYLKDSKGHIFDIYDNITCIGDSLTYCSVFTGSSTSRKAKRTWPELLGVKTGATVETIAQGGINISNWWNTYGENIVPKDNQLVIIYLGTNGGMTDTVASDCAGDDPTQFADTHTGNYGRIIAKCLSVGAKVLLVKIYGGYYVEDTNNAIDDFTEKFNVACVDNLRLPKLYHLYPNLSGYNDLHYNDLGYHQFLNQLMFNVDNLSDDMITRLFPQ